MGNFIFIILILLTLFLSFIANKKNNKICLLVSITIASIIVGLRGINVGIDTPAYYHSIINHFPYAWEFEEVGFRFISNLLFNIFGDAKYVILTYAFITNLLIFYRLWDLRHNFNFTFMVFIYLFVYLFDTMNIMRQFLSIALIFYSTKFLQNKKYLIYIIAVITASFIHKTSLLALAILLIYVWNDLPKRKKILLAVPLIIVCFFGVNWIFEYESDHIYNYFSTSNIESNINLPFIYRFVIFTISYRLVIKKKKLVINRKYLYKNNKDNLLNSKYFKKISLIYFLGLIFASAGMFFNNMSRLGYFYLIFEILYWGYITKVNYNKNWHITMFSIYAIYIFIIEILTSGSGIFPYYFNF